MNREGVAGEIVFQVIEEAADVVMSMKTLFRGLMPRTAGQVEHSDDWFMR